MNSPSSLSVTNTPAQNKGAMPLRIATLALHHGEGLPLELAQEQPIELLLEQFGPTLEKAIDLVTIGEMVWLKSPSDSLLLLPAIDAAKRKLHPHAYMAGLQFASTAQTSLNMAMAQAKRAVAALGQHLTVDNNDSQAQFTALFQLVHDIGRRNLRRLSGDNTYKQHYWFNPPHQARVAALSLTDEQQRDAVTNMTLVLTQGTGRIKARSLLNASQLFFPLTGTSEAELNQQLWTLAAKLDAISSVQQLLTLMQTNLNHFAENRAGRFAMVLQANGIAAMQQEIAAMSDALSKLFSTQGQYKTPAGSYFSAAPLGQSQLAFVYPGVGTVYQGMLSELHLYFPALYARLEQQGELQAMLQSHAIYHSDKSVAANMSLDALAIAGVGASYLLTKLLVDEFDIKPKFALGYSMGEAAMWASLDVWRDPHQLITKTQTDPLFTSVISGDLTAVRQAWQLSNDESIEWNSFVVRSTPEPITALLDRYPRVYLAITQGDTCVIAGCQHSCQALLKELGKRGIAANRVTAMHTPPALTQHQAVIEFYRQPLLDEATSHEVKFISAADTGKGKDCCVAATSGQLDSQCIAESIADTFCNTLDFTGLIHSAKRQGAKLFVEVGADRQNCTLIDKILKDDSQTTHCCTVPVNAKGGSDTSTLLKAIGQLISHRVPVSLTVLQLGLKRELDKLPNDSAPSHHANPLLQGEA
ncbi:PfaB family protein [Shewanella colwelliana]|uniref:Omega-3 polyunsaturated fatty acid synthase PfaB n=2 Tax=Shewanella colwelliana TaxID=23 RepID=A0ABQ4NZS8_SHECO|nr:PfaB family protein [Shewanella colwelliana]MDX1283168.1 PfaB family protein [Shewanella colwelliana]GIU40512.1 omega-3 polyunsaturated fatty acid synthase PfaB [Shewanella colwelliana]